MSSDKPFMVKSVMNRIAKHADVFTVRAPGTLDWVVREYVSDVGRDPTTLDIAPVQAGCVVDKSHRDRALWIQRKPMETLMGTNCSWEHLQQCYLLGSVDGIVAS